MGCFGTGNKHYRSQSETPMTALPALAGECERACPAVRRLCPPSAFGCWCAVRTSRSRNASKWCVQSVIPITTPQYRLAAYPTPPALLPLLSAQAWRMAFCGWPVVSVARPMDRSRRARSGTGRCGASGLRRAIHKRNCASRRSSRALRSSEGRMGAMFESTIVRESATSTASALLRSRLSACGWMCVSPPARRSWGAPGPGPRVGNSAGLLH
jgi:hypothetical protein